MSFQKKCYDTSEDLRFQNFILLLIVLNAVLIGIDTFELSSNLKSLIDVADIVILYIFIVELLIRLVAHGTKFFNDGWNNFDFVIIIISLAPSSGAFNVFRVFRVFRALRLVSSMPEMQRMVEAMMRSLRGIAAISWLLCIVVYVYSVMGTI
ncbi:MAG: ion transporter, partial [Candidatus Poseidoniaceae archaeon]